MPWSRRRLLARIRSTRSPTRSLSDATDSGHRRDGLQREVVGRLPADARVVRVEVELLDFEDAVERGKLVERSVQQLVGDVVGDRHMGVVRKGQLGGERASA